MFGNKCVFSPSCVPVCGSIHPLDYLVQVPFVKWRSGVRAFKGLKAVRAMHTAANARNAKGDFVSQARRAVAHFNSFSALYAILGGLLTAAVSTTHVCDGKKASEAEKEALMKAYETEKKDSRPKLTRRFPWPGFFVSSLCVTTVCRCIFLHSCCGGSPSTRSTQPFVGPSACMYSQLLLT